MFFSCFGGAWLILGIVRSSHHNPALIVLAVLCSLTILILAYRKYTQNRAALAAEASSPASKRRSRWFNIINAGQWILLILIGNILVNIGLSAWVIPAAILIVGLHFLPLAGLFSYPAHYITGAALILIAATYPFLTAQGPLSPVGCYGAGLVLWLSALYGLTA